MAAMHDYAGLADRPSSRSWVARPPTRRSVPSITARRPAVLRGRRFGTGQDAGRPDLGVLRTERQQQDRSEESRRVLIASDDERGRQGHGPRPARPGHPATVVDLRADAVAALVGEGSAVTVSVALARSAVLAREPFIAPCGRRLGIGVRPQFLLPFTGRGCG